MDGNFTPEKIIAHGGFGIVVRVNHAEYGIAALKIMKFRGKEASNEGKLGMSVDHKNCVKCFDYSISPIPAQDASILKLKRYLKRNKKMRKLWNKLEFNKDPIQFSLIFTEYCNGGKNLQDWIVLSQYESKDQKLSDMYFLQLVEGVDFLHDKCNIVHGDLKPQNVLLHQTKEGTLLKIADFGEAFFQDGKDHSSRHTPIYTDPAFKGKLTRKTKEYDIYSLGCISVLMFISGFCTIDGNLVETEKQREDAFHSLLWDVRESGLRTITKSKTYFKREELIRKMMISPNQGRINAFAIQQEYQFFLNQSEVFSKVCRPSGKNPVFSGRKQILKKLEHLIDNDSKLILIHGIHGAGKKSVCQELCHRYSESPRFSKIYWFNANSRKSLEKCYQKIEEHGEKISCAEPFLAVYENTLDYSEIEDLLPTKISVNSIIICISTKDSDAWPLEFRRLQVEALPLKDCKSLIKQSIKLTDSRRDATAYSSLQTEQHCNHLAIKYCQLPTPIVKAVAKINLNQYNSPIQTFLEQHNESTVPSQVLPYFASVLRVIKEIKKNNSLTILWLKICSYMDPQGIPEILLDTLINLLGESDGVKKKSEVKRLVLLNSIMRYDPTTLSFSMDRAVQEPLQIEYKSCFKDTLQLVSDIIRDLVLPKNKGGLDPIRGNKMKELTPHLECLIRNIDTYLQSSVDFFGYSPCLPKDSKLIQILKLDITKTLKRFYISQGFSEKVANAIQEIADLKSHLFGSKGWRDGLEFMARGSAEMKDALSSQSQDFEQKILSAIINLQKSKKKLVENQKDKTPRLEAIQCYFHLGRCYNSLIHPKYFHPMKRDTFEIETVNKMISYLIESQNYYKEALVLLKDMAKCKRNVFRDISHSLKCIAMNYGYLHEKEDFENQEKYLVLSLIFCTLHYNLNEEDDNNIAKKLEILEDISSFQVEDALTDEFALSLTNSHPNLYHIHSINDRLLKFYKCEKNEINRKQKNTDHTDDLYFTKEKENWQKLQMINMYRHRLRDLKKLKKAAPVRSTTKPEETVELPSASVENCRTTQSEEISRIKMKEITKLANEKMDLATKLKRDHKLEAALEQYKKALELLLLLHKRDSVAIAKVHERIGECHVRLGDKIAGCQSYKEAYKMWGTDSTLNKDRVSEYAELIKKLVRVMPKEKGEKKVKLIEECIQVMGKCYGETHVQVGIFREKQGAILIELEKYQEAQKPLEEALAILEKLPNGNENKISCLQKLVKVYESPIFKKKTEQYTKMLETEISILDYQPSFRAVKTKKKKQRLKQIRGETT